MAVDDIGQGCARRGDPECPTIGYFSNPRLKYRGDRLGVDRSRVGVAADNASTIRRWAGHVSGYRVTKEIDLPAILSPDPTRLVRDTLNLEIPTECEPYNDESEFHLEYCRGALIRNHNEVITFSPNGRDITGWRVVIGRTLNDAD